MPLECFTLFGNASVIILYVTERTSIIFNLGGNLRCVHTLVFIVNERLEFKCFRRLYTCLIMQVCYPKYDPIIFIEHFSWISFFIFWARNYIYIYFLNTSLKVVQFKQKSDFINFDGDIDLIFSSFFRYIRVTADKHIENQV